MKTILVPTDFSNIASNALDYAAEMALYTKAKIILLHVYDNTPPALDIPVVIPSPIGLESSVKLELEKEKTRIERKYGDHLITNIEFKWGFVTEEINNYAKENHIDLVVMGMQGANYIVERFLGSTATMVMRKSVAPVLIIDKHVTFKRVNKIVLAIDGRETDYEVVLKPLKKIANIFKSHLYVLHMVPALATTIDLEKGGFDDIANEMDGIDHSFHYHSSNEVVYNINAFADEVNADMIVMIPHKHNLLDGILMEAETKRMAFHTKLPLLSLHD